MKYISSETLFHYQWKDLVCAYWQRYPNPHSRHVLSDDVLERTIVNGCLRSVRVLLKTTAKPPRWAEIFIHSRSVAVIEESILDPVKETLTTYTHNIGPYKKVLNVEEKCIFRPQSDNQTMTILSREAWVTSSIRGVGGMIERFGLERFKKHANGAIAGFNVVLSQLYPQYMKDCTSGPPSKTTITPFNVVRRTKTTI